MRLPRFPRAADITLLASLLLLSAPGLLRAQTARPESGGRPPITGIAFMRVFTTDAAAADKFYGPTMGFPRLTLGDESLFAVNHSQWIEVSHTGAPPTPNSRLLAVGFTTTDLPALGKYLAQHGVQPEDPMHAGSLSIRDPEGNHVVFVQAEDNPQSKTVAAAQPLPSATSQRLIHVGFIVHDRAKEDAFWRDLLGFRPYWYGTMHPGRTDFVSLQVPDGTDWLEYMMMPSSSIANLHDAGMSDHFSLGVDHMQTVLAGLQRNGCEGKMCTAIQAGVDGKVQLNLFDPDQTRVEYMEFVPVMKPCCSDFTGKHPSESDAVK